MSQWFSRARSLIFEVPRYGKLAYCLLRDERVPKAPKAALLTSLGLIASPLDLPAWIPIVGEFDVLALGVLAVRVFVESCPEELVREHEAALATGTSAFDRDLRGILGLARDRASEAIYRLRSKEIA
jgi:uncharacterized membrane protein YkvA (DUF1232 family)